MIEVTSAIVLLIAALYAQSFALVVAGGGTKADLSGLTGPYLGQEPPGDTAKLFAPGIVSTCHEHSAAMFTPDGNEVWFGRLLPAAIYYMTRKEGTWTTPRIAPFSGREVDLYPYLAQDGNRLVFTSRRPFEAGGEPLPRSGGHLWMAVRDRFDWKEPEYLGSDLNFSGRLACGSVAADGTMYIGASVQTDGRKTTDMYVSRLTNGHYGPPTSLGGVLNSPEPEHCPFIAADGSYLIFSSFRGGFGLSDLFISFRRGDGSWTEPVNLGKKINSAVKDEYPYITPDGKYLFFNSNRVSALNANPVPDGPGNIYWVEASFIEGLKPAEITGQ